MEKSTRTESRARRSAASKDAIALLKADHRQVEKWFAEFKKARSASRKAKLAEQICDALKVHTTIEEEIFYPAFLAATQDEDKHHEAEVEHEGAKKLIKTIEEMDADDDYFEARVKVLSEMIKHHVKEEEQPGGMFAEARKSDMDLEGLGARMKARKEQLQANGGIIGLSAGSGPRLNA
ncbi:MAG TPA: hemerythrin domain-containing protein [Steroidobacteraceae bacterium]|nr:hemerythrin domain-containing protein [Steroidobacteraceae bacterium]